ncbi:ABC transporter ATP-binding protein [Streptacidiphilus sp. ASG 303]|uniref:ABC transporter ATP-binding protein n=1 Tax=Streptacidiphilus sp. ASG 303 TaxID=2896847 RepID=UPI001E468F58|nr:ABC transporter ATP-binding protein [Streptacidiphilus sp. ASG 303]MCD0481057.1 ABC transporter ATP-binding protein [Streptacidiphilus sp. ASG 303]
MSASAPASAAGPTASAGPAEAAPAALEVRGLTVVHPPRGGRGPARAVDGVDLRLEQGEILALIGESGCGKSTLARALVGLTRPTSGEVLYRGTPLRYTGSALKAYRRHTQLVLQDPGGALNPRQTVFDAVAEGPRLHGLKEGLEERVRSALSRAGLRPPEDFLARYPHQLSGGQQQRVVIAGALALDPAVVVADEPVASLDASVRGEILQLVLRLRDELGLSALVVSHDLGLAWNIADRVAVMYLGRIVEVGTVEDVLLRPVHPYTRALLSVLPGPDRGRRPTVLTGEAPDPTAVPAGCRFHPRCPAWAALDGPGREAAGCTVRELPVLTADPGAGRQAACHLVDAAADTPAGGAGTAGAPGGAAQAPGAEDGRG